jgi:hypothetical protein
MQIQEATKRLVAGRSKPCGFVLRAPENDPKHERSPLALFFRRPDRWWRLQAAERDRRVLENLVPAFSHHRVVALYRESAGWIFVSHSLPARAKE